MDIRTNWQSDRDAAKARESVFFGSLPDEVFHAVFDPRNVLSFASGQTIFRQGEPADAIFAVLDGLVKLTIGSPDGREIVVEVFHAGTSFAEALAFKDALYPVTATTLLDSRILMVPNHKIQFELRSNPDAFGAVLSATYAHLHRLVRQIEQLKSSTGQQRVAQFVLALAESHPGAVEFVIPYKKQILASLLGIKPETLSRVFKRLEPFGVSVNGSRIGLQDLSKLRRLIEIA